MQRILLLAMLSLLIITNGCTTTGRDARIKRKAARIHERVLTIDSHVDTPLRIVGEGVDMGQRNDPRQGGNKLDFIRMAEGGLDVAWFAAYVGQGERTPKGNNRARARVMELIQSVYQSVEKYPDLATLAFAEQDAYQITKTGKRAIYLGIENGYAIGNDLSNLQSFHNLGVRYMTLCHVKNNDICDSSNDTTEHNGLSQFGRQVVAEMNRIGMIVDVSHISDKAFYDVLAVSTAPVIASHSCARAIRKHERNLDDAMLRALADKGGVIQMNILSYYVKHISQDPERDSVKTALMEKWADYDNLPPEQQKLADEEYRRFKMNYPPILATVSDAVDHIDHIVKIAGIDHVGIGTDFDGGGDLADCYDVSEIGNITLELVRRGYSQAAIAKIWGTNLQRVFRAVEQAAQ